MTLVNVVLAVPPDLEHYLESSARIRNISRAHILRMAMEFVLRDKMFLSIFDDDDKPNPKTAPRSRRGRTFGSTTRPDDNLFDTTRSYSVPQKRKQQWGAPRAPKLSLDDLQQAVLNTGGELVK